MTEIILKTHLESRKLKALLEFLRSWNIDAEVKTTPKKSSEEKISFFDGEGIWKDYDIDGKELRKRAWERNK
ncbi:hypothetical protein MTP09_14020 [Chryseobacterium suipulveris]|uniref:Uncharacterized protein n=1 Tax=Chryseobacterium suipulveris TaxID=2929800 RepID=A0ABY4BP93_9FLAO|nr:hypothetical protein [Chryseobacterium suipulveris]UOE41001.1 hypothetical protein MTP09_14020 [Chryseobacterium suipulveris]